MATTTTSTPTAVPLFKTIEIKLWSKRIALAILAIIIAALIARWIKTWDGWSGNATDWGPVSVSTKCAPTWNAAQGWCNLGKFPKGTYRIVPKFETWQMKLMPSNPPQPTDIDFLPIPPQGIDAQNYLQSNELVDEFLRSAFVKSRNYGSLIVKTSEMAPIEVLSSTKPREFKIANESADILINVNISALPGKFAGNEGSLVVEVQKLTD